ncbi:MAG: hypothetical protein UW69_C0081G0001 [Microgenomates group bacterium GW2011_GWA2_44_7]|uniref:Uncharacterized protein n=1 Tax=Candidatus Gottesmanbacteria bacterium GW2011_GWA1_48_13 TaxID=1618439 RepID=A0A0G1WX62_9BACT|nr:MAG: hypothetical protein UW69_C0081G0001 [Microgenomates group bacterium GW2011_GWA2_44_7]KKU94943.1 MAG: hypothetical protein UY27_C0029G0001 [Candidatus Gottesmanbacteria bacterium GW2011_GWA1_48_13]
MDTTILQVPLSKTLKKSAQEAANEYGFSSLQDLLRVVLTKLSRRELVVSIEEPLIHLSKKNEERYLKMTEDFKKNRRVYHANSAKGLIQQLHED